MVLAFTYSRVGGYLEDFSLDGLETGALTLSGGGPIQERRGCTTKGAWASSKSGEVVVGGASGLSLNNDPTKSSGASSMVERRYKLIKTEV
ncbi:hypothetical protein LIER_04504 [Lithospermum erythrorhizon]|uniref:Uncharacterized protein n=1 Tax=Lithospermum erythrorhizon TaxID=34254 RepID=A0AAV3NYU7_LITER